MKNRLIEMESFLQNQPKDISKYDEQQVRRLIEKITVHEAKMAIEFKSGINLNLNF